MKLSGNFLHKILFKRKSDLKSILPSFNHYQLIPEIRNYLEKKNYSTPSPIQKMTL